jgi:hypothetical protein
MAHQISPAMVTQLSEKLEAFSSSLSDAERTIFQGMINARLSNEALDKVVGGAHQPFEVASFAPQLSASFFRSNMCW